MNTVLQKHFGHMNILLNPGGSAEQSLPSAAPGQTPKTSP
jgi:hypothetical protein